MVEDAMPIIGIIIAIVHIVFPFLAFPVVSFGIAARHFCCPTIPNINPINGKTNAKTIAITARLYAEDTSSGLLAGIVAFGFPGIVILGFPVGIYAELFLTPVIHCWV